MCVAVGLLYVCGYYGIIYVYLCSNMMVLVVQF